MATLTFFGSENGGILSRSTTTALTFFDPITAPTPPRAERRAGRPSLSLNAMPAIRPSYSPTGPQSAIVTFLPYLACSMFWASKLPLPRYGAASSNSIVPSFLKWITTQSGEASSRVNPAIFCCPSP